MAKRGGEAAQHGLKQRNFGGWRQLQARGSENGAAGIAQGKSLTYNVVSVTAYTGSLSTSVTYEMHGCVYG